MEEKILVEFANTYKALANPIRIRIVLSLKAKDLAANELADELKLSKAHLFQHTNMLLDNGIINIRREGINAIYSLADKRILDVLNIMRSLCLKKLSANKRLLSKARKYKI